MNVTIAVPSMAPGGLQAPLGLHFGHCDLYTMIRVDNGKVTNVDIIPTISHQQGGCMAPVMYLSQKGAGALIAGGMGLRPLMGFNQAGIAVYYGGKAETVGDAVMAFIEGNLTQFTPQQTCGGGNSIHAMGQ